MERLRAGDVAALLATLPDLYAFQTLDAFSTTLTSAIPRLIGSEVTSYTEVEPGRGRTRVATRPQGAVSPAQHERFAQLSHQHPLVRHYRENRDSRALKITDVMPQSNFRKLPIYEEFFRPVGVDRQLAITLASTASVVVGLALNRRGSDFTERDRLMLDLLRPHAVQAYENATTASAVLAELKATRRIIEEADAGIVILGHEGEVRSMSAGARALLNQCFDGGGHWASGAALPDDLDRWVVSRLAALRDAEQPPEWLHPLTIVRGDLTLRVRLAFSASGESPILMLQEVAGTEPQIPLEVLSAREREVVALVARGRSNKEVARECGISVLTVKKHLEHIYRKLGVTNRTAAAQAWSAQVGPRFGSTAAFRSERN